MAQPFFHLNSCVYEILLNEDGTTRNFMKQVNNPILCRDFSISNMYNCSANELTKDINKNTLTYMCFPISDETLDKKYEKLLCVNGTTLKGQMPDLNKPVIRNHNDPDAIDKTYDPTFTEVPFLFIIPITPEYMFDITFSHVPSTAVIKAEHLTNTQSVNKPQGINFNTQMVDGTEPRSEADWVIQEVDRQKLMWLSNGHDESTFVVDISMAAARLGMDEAKIKLLL